MIPPHALLWRDSPRERLPRWREFLRDFQQERDVRCGFGLRQTAHKRAKCESPPPPAIDRMLELTRRRRQANPSRQCYNFSLVPKTGIRVSCCGCRKRTAANRRERNLQHLI